jgi:hypothetical protein
VVEQNAGADGGADAYGTAMRPSPRWRRRLSVFALVAGSAVIVTTSANLTNEVLPGPRHVHATTTSGRHDFT